MVPTPAGNFKHRVTIRRRNDNVKNVLGEVDARDDHTETRWAAVRTLSTREQLLAGENVHHLTHEVRLRYTPALEPDDTLEWQGRTLHIKSLIDIDAERRELLLLCSEQGGQ